tara:strand:+ start:185 stop:559 length:375 start_codon:yes stop_codon:yes gene_type:complete
MAFTRSNINSNPSFTRDGAVRSAAIPGFEIFTPSVGEFSTFSLGKNWTLTTEVGNSPSLNFKYNGDSVLELSTAGIVNLSLPSLKLNDNQTLPLASGYNEGDLIKKSGVLYVLIDDGTPGNNPD